jgi:hypothetical protein
MHKRSGAADKAKITFGTAHPGGFDLDQAV